jgi:hypothetical protein
VSFHLKNYSHRLFKHAKNENHFIISDFITKGQAVLFYQYRYEKKKMQAEMIRLRIKLNLAREKLQKAWDANGVTNAHVLQASDEFDVLLNEYQRLVKKLGL